MPEEDRLTPEETSALLHIARDSIRSRLQGTPPPPRRSVGGRLSRSGGVFVSLHARGALRGCIGTFASSAPLHQTVAEIAVSSATEDSRFPPLALKELDQVDIEISVLSPLHAVQSPQDIIVGTHGIYITSEYHRGVLLPQVATENGWDRDTFLDHTCRKAGLPAGAWRKGGVKIEIFTAQVFHDTGGDHG